MPTDSQGPIIFMLTAIAVLAVLSLIGALGRRRHYTAAAVIAMLAWLVAALAIVATPFGLIGLAMLLALAPAVLALVLVKIIRASGSKPPQPQAAALPPTPIVMRPRQSEHERRTDALIRDLPEVCAAVGLAVVDGAATEEYRLRGRDAQGDGTVLGAMSAAATLWQQSRVGKERGTVVAQGQVRRVPVVVQARSDEYISTLWLTLPHGLAPAYFAKEAERLRSALRAMKVSATQDREEQREGVVRLAVFYGDPLADGSQRAQWDGDWSAVPVGRFESGAPACLRIKNQAGAVVGGVPGSGKSASVADLVGMLATNSAVQLAVLDGKGGADWSWVKKRAAIFSNDDEDVSVVAGELEALVALMRWRVQHMYEMRGTSNFWDQGPTEDLPLVVVIVDECHTYVNPAEIGVSKEAKELAARCTTALGALVKKGRSAGIFAMAMTQKPTADALPTPIRSNAALRIAFRVAEMEAERAIFGASPGDGQPSAIDLPEDGGYCVLEQTAGHREVARWTYTPESELYRIAEHTAPLAWSRDQLIPMARAAEPSAAV